MEAVAKHIVELAIAGVNVTAAVSPYVSRITYSDKVDAESDDVTIILDDTSGVWQEPWFPEKGDTLTLKIGKTGDMLDCGLFEIDQTEFEFPPDMFAIKAIGAAITKELRTRNSKSFEKQTLKAIAQYFADKHGLRLTGDVGKLGKITIDRKTQDTQTDIAFLATTAKEYGLLFSVRGDMLVFMDEQELEAREPVATITRDQMSRGVFTDKTSQTFGGVVVASRDIRTNTVRRWSIQPSGAAGEQDTLVQHAWAESDSQAQAKAAAALREKNKEKTTGTISLPGNTSLVSGVTITLPDIGRLSGKWYVTGSSHTVSRENGYTTDINVRKIYEAA